MNIIQIARMNDDEAREYLESIRWPEGPVCPHCGSKNVVKLQGKSTRPGVHKCKKSECRKQFTVTVNTVFHRSKLPLNKMIIAFHMMSSSKKGVSAHQMHRTLGITYKTAWHLAHRIRAAMKEEPLAGMLSGTVEVHVSKEHLHRYCDEFAFRWNHRKADDIERMRAAIAMSAGKRLTYRQPKNA